ncbi:hypothetical protein BOX15_Mlig027659g3, partial [Macrostomum lignano]
KAGKFAYKTCDLGCHDVCDLLLTSMTKLQKFDKPIRGRFRPQMRREARPFLDRMLVNNCLRRLCDIMTKEAGLADEDVSRKRPVEEAQSRSDTYESECSIETKKICLSNDKNNHTDNSNHGNSKFQHRRLNSLVLVTENYQPVRLTQHLRHRLWRRRRT